jgi:ataxia telangiectasia mutated family protein
VRPGKDYGYGKEDPIGGERIAGFESDFAITDSGIHRPKIVVCTGSRGGSFRQLVKGEDDIRQDAIMSQVFTYVNNLMKRRNSNKMPGEGPSNSDTVTRRTRHKLNMVTYNVLPLSPSSGVLEWVEGTLPIMDFLTGSYTSGEIGAHSRYYPNEWSYRLCRSHLESSSADEKRQSFDEVCARSSPSFRFFFLERFGSCMESWHSAKMSFTRSVAVSSIVGHILGIGDRHLGNILIHQGTGEVVHIDFGCVFEQGKLLMVPESVPFRLTRNIVDGMGPCGTGGLFVKVSEETISMLRKHARELLTILSAVVADPLYRWSVNPIEARRRQAEKDEEKGYKIKDRGSVSTSDERSQATKTLSKIKEKLQGYEDSTSGEQQGVEGQVQLLINSARDPNNLCTMFPGWGPWI